jgi:hypothetical protein
MLKSRMFGVLRLCVCGFAPALLAGCGLPPPMTPIVAVGVAAAVTAGSVMTIGRSPTDALYSLISGRDCSIVRLDEGKSYCRPVDPPPEKPRFCTHSLALPNCWADPATLPGHPTPLADAPAMTAEQEAYRVRRWPWW